MKKTKLLMNLIFHLSYLYFYIILELNKLDTLWKERISYLLYDYIVYFSVINLKIYKSNLHICIFFLTFWLYLLFMPNTYAASEHKIMLGANALILTLKSLCYLCIRLYHISSYCDRSRIAIMKWSVIEIYNTYFHTFEIRDEAMIHKASSQQYVYSSNASHLSRILPHAITILCHIGICQLTLLHGINICFEMIF